MELSEVYGLRLEITGWWISIIGWEGIDGPLPPTFSPSACLQIPSSYLLWPPFSPHLNGHHIKTDTAATETCWISQENSYNTRAKKDRVWETRNRRTSWGIPTSRDLLEEACSHSRSGAMKNQDWGEWIKTLILSKVSRISHLTGC